MSKLTTLMVVAAVIALSCVSAVLAVSIETVTIGDPGNASDNTTYGSVSVTYNIGKYEVTNNQYAEFLNAVAASDPKALYNTRMASRYGGITRSGSSPNYTYDVIPGRGNMPVNYVSWYDALRFVNWMHNGQPTGMQDASTTEDGAYNMSLGSSAVRKPGAMVFLPTEDEWYKAAYYKGGGIHTGYWNYPTSSDTEPIAGVPPGTMTNSSANYNFAANGDLTDVGAYTYKPSVSAYGTYDQGGNVAEWNEDIRGSIRILRGGSFVDLGWSLHATNRNSTLLTREDYFVGFRIAEVAKPENESPEAVCLDVTVSAYDNCQGTVELEDVDGGSFDPDDDPIVLTMTPPGSYQLGITSITLTVTDEQGASDSCTATVTVVDATPPVITCPANVSSECDQPTDPSVTGEATAIDDCDGAPVITFLDSLLQGSCLQEMVITRTWTATDAAGNSASADQVITVVDTTPPVIELIGDYEITLECHLDPYIELGATATDNCDTTLTDATIGGDVVDIDNPGIYTVMYDATDDCANVATQVTRIVNVVDTSPPEVLVADMLEVWPPNHKYHTFNLSECMVNVQDACEGKIDVDAAGTIVSIYSDEPEDARGTGDGQTVDDIVILGPSSFKVRAERQGTGNGRIYGVTFDVTDAFGNSTTATCYIGVPHDKSGDPPVDDGPAVGYTVP